MRDLINETTPINIAEEKAKFFASDTYNPKLKYQQVVIPTELSMWGMPNEKFFNHALKMLKAPQVSATPDLEQVTTDYIEQTVAAFNQKYRLDPPINVIFSENMVSRCKVTEKTIYFQLPIRYTKSKFDDLCRHELESHLLRRINHNQQPWADLEVPEVEIRRTEEGIANLHTHLLRENKLLTKSYLTYSAVYLAQTGSFRQVFNAMTEQGISPGTAWQLALRTKRGLEDTAQPGGLTKDICYLEGTVAVWDWLINQSNQAQDLYLGRLSLDLIPSYKNQALLNHLKLPSFFDDINEYHKNVIQLGEVNDFGSLL